MPPAQASFVRCICGVDKRQESSEDACRPCDRSAAASASSRHVGRHETSIDEGGEQAHRSLKQRGSPPLESRGSKHPPQTRRPQPLRPPSRRAGPRAVAAPSPAFSSRKVSQFAIHSTWVLPEDRLVAGAPWRVCAAARAGGVEGEPPRGEAARAARRAGARESRSSRATLRPRRRRTLRAEHGTRARRRRDGGHAR